MKKTKSTFTSVEEDDHPLQCATLIPWPESDLSARNDKIEQHITKQQPELGSFQIAAVVTTALDRTRADRWDLLKDHR